MGLPPSALHFAGCLVGQALGDALGFPVEGTPPGTCQQYVEEVLRSGRAAQAHRFGYPPLQYTDDTQLARELMRSLVERRGFDPEDYAARIATIFREDRIVGRGRATDQAARRLNRGIPWDQAGTPPPSAGNGTAMRAAPVGLFYWNDEEAMLRAAHLQGFITHQDPRCSAGSIAIAGAVWLALRMRPLDARAFAGQLAAWTRSWDPHLAEGLLRLPAWAQLPPEEAVKSIGRVGMEPRYWDLEGWQGISPFVTTSVLWSLYAFLHSPDDYWATVCTAIAVGGDVDTTGAMAGAVSGAYLGLSSLPEDLARGVNDRGSWGYEDLVRLAEACYRVAVDAQGQDPVPPSP
ncbi:MAG: ADP-ribosylglycohydrolase family protein [Anaerolineae bacterium]